MKVHHLNALSMCPLLGRALNASGRLVTHCLVVETESGLVLVDTGVGEATMTQPPGLPRLFRTFLRPALKREETIKAQLPALGFSVDDVRHILLTHLDLDHAAGLSDFPRATVHVFADEHRAAMARATWWERERYLPSLWAHGARFSLASLAGDTWRGFEAVRQLEGLPPEILMIPLRGHTRGHTGIAVDTGAGWLLHCGDAYFYKGELDIERPHCTAGFRVFESMLASDDGERKRNRDRLLALKRASMDITLFSSHDPDELADLKLKSRSATR